MGNFRNGMIKHDIGCVVITFSMLKIEGSSKNSDVVLSCTAQGILKQFEIETAFVVSFMRDK